MAVEDLSSPSLGCVFITIGTINIMYSALFTGDVFGADVIRSGCGRVAGHPCETAGTRDVPTMARSIAQEPELSP